MKYSLYILEDIPIKVGTFYVHVDFMILDMAEDAYTQIILRRLLLAIAGYKIDVKEGKLICDVWEYHDEFGLFKDHESSHCSFPYCECDEILFDTFVNLIHESSNYPQVLDCEFF